MEERLRGCKVAESVEAKFEALPKQGKPQGREKTVLAGFVLKHDEDARVVALLPNVVGSALFRPVGGAQLGAGGRFYHRSVLEGGRRAFHSHREQLADVMGVHEAETAVENSEALSPGDAAVGEDGEELASKSKGKLEGGL